MGRQFQCGDLHGLSVRARDHHTSYRSPLPRSSSRPGVSATKDPPRSMVLSISLRLARSRKHCAGLIAPSIPFAHTRGEFDRLSERSRADARLCRASECLNGRPVSLDSTGDKRGARTRIVYITELSTLLVPNPVDHGGDPMRPGSQIHFQVSKRSKHHALIAAKIAGPPKKAVLRGQGADLLETRFWDALSDRVASYSASRSCRTAAI